METPVLICDEQLPVDCGRRDETPVSTESSVLPAHLDDGQGQSSPVRTMRLTMRALKGRWPASRKRKASMLDAAFKIVEDDDADPDVKLRAIKVFLEADRLNLECIRLAMNAERPAPQHTTINVAGNVQAVALDDSALAALSAARAAIRQQ